MSMMWRETCILEVQRDGDTKTKPSCSGIILDAVRGLVISHGSLIWPILDPSHRSRLLEKGHLQGHDLYQYSVRAIVEHKEVEKRSQKTAGDQWKHLSLGFQVDANRCGSNIGDKRRDRNLSEIKGEIVSVWKSVPFEDTLRRMMPPSEGWKFTDDEDKEKTETDTDDLKLNNPNNKHDSDSKDSFEMLPFFLIIKLDKKDKSTQCLLNISHPSRVALGERVFMVGTPFGSLSPVVFMNSVSEGVLSNVAGNIQEMLLTDARAIPGSEGGALYSENSEIIGMVVASLCWKSSEWIGLSICSSLHTAISTLPNKDAIFSEQQLGKVLQSTEVLTSHTSNSRAFAQRVALIRSGGCWGSGVVIDSHQGVLLTCSHVVRNRRGKTVSVVRTYPTREVLRARVVFDTPPGEVYDLAVLRLETPWTSTHTEQEPTPRIRVPHQGEAVYAVGHACFPEQLSRQPSVTKGTVSKVISHQGRPVMVQSTCAVHAGASGGPLVAEDGTMVGLIACNAKDLVSGSSYPHINMSVPMVTIWSTLTRYLHTHDERVLEDLHINEDHAKALWSLRDGYCLCEEVLAELINNRKVVLFSPLLPQKSSDSPYVYAEMRYTILSKQTLTWETQSTFIRQSTVLFMS